VPNVLAVHPSVKANDLPGFLALLRSQPGKFSYASSGTGGIGHMMGELFLSASHTTMVHIPYRGAGPAINDVIAGQVPVLFDNLPSSIEHIRSGRLRALAVAAPARLDALPAIPTFAQSGLPGQIDAVARSIARTVQTARAVTARSRESGTGAVPGPFQAPQTSLNGAISGHRRFAFLQAPLDDIQTVRRVFGGTVNDVVLAGVSGALRRLLSDRGEILDEPLVAMVPLSTRSSADAGILGNKVHAMLVSLATTVDDPVERLRVISSGTRLAKEQARVPTFARAKPMAMDVTEDEKAAG